MTVVETARFLKDAASLVDDDMRTDLVAYIASHPEAGVVILSREACENCDGH